jgi:small subunit ribosomal protein S19
MARSLKKGPYVDEKLISKLEKLDRSGDKTPVKTWARRCTITQRMVGYTFAVHNGKKFIAVYATENMVGHKLGEFSPTRTFRAHGHHTEKTSALK